MRKYIPNFLTILRFILVPFSIYCLSNDMYILVIILLLASGLTDILDGAIARKYNLITNFGKLMDPLADKITQLSILCVLVIKHLIPLWILIIVLLKEVSMIVGASFLYGKELVVSSKWYGKVATVLFYLAIVITFISKEFEVNLHIGLTLYYIAIAMTLFSLVMYFREFYVAGYFKKDSLKINEKIKEND